MFIFMFKFMSMLKTKRPYAQCHSVLIILKCAWYIECVHNSASAQ